MGLGNAIYAQSSTDDPMLAHPAGPRLALDQRPMAAGHRRQPTAEEIYRRIDERGTAPGASRFSDKDREVQQLYDEIMHQTDAALRPEALRP